MSDTRDVYSRLWPEATDSDDLTDAWEARRELEIPQGSYAGSLEKQAEPIAGRIRDPSRRQVEFTAPQIAGPYRIFVSVYDGNGLAAYANVPFCISPE